MRSVEELNKMMGEFAGFKVAISSHTEEPQRVIWNGWEYPTGELGSLPNFTGSFDACTLWIIPEVAKTSEIRITIPPNTEKRFLVGIGHQGDVEDEFLPLALCRAVEKLIDNN